VRVELARTQQDLSDAQSELVMAELAVSHGEETIAEQQKEVQRKARRGSEATCALTAVSAELAQVKQESQRAREEAERAWAEAERYEADARVAKDKAEHSAQQAEKAKEEATGANARVEQAKREAEAARRELAQVRTDLDKAREEALREAEEARRELTQVATDLETAREEALREAADLAEPAEREAEEARRELTQVRTDLDRALEGALREADLAKADAKRLNLEAEQAREEARQAQIKAERAVGTLSAASAAHQSAVDAACAAERSRLKSLVAETGELSVGLLAAIAAARDRSTAADVALADALRGVAQAAASAEGAGRETTTERSVALREKCDAHAAAVTAALVGALAEADAGRAAVEAELAAQEMPHSDAVSAVELAPAMAWAAHNSSGSLDAVAGADRRARPKPGLSADFVSLSATQSGLVQTVASGVPPPIVTSPAAQDGLSSQSLKLPGSHFSLTAQSDPVSLVSAAAQTPRLVGIETSRFAASKAFPPAIEWRELPDQASADGFGSSAADGCTTPEELRAAFLQFGDPFSAMDPSLEPAAPSFDGGAMEPMPLSSAAVPWSQHEHADWLQLSSTERPSNDWAAPAHHSVSPAAALPDLFAEAFSFTDSGASVSGPDSFGVAAFPDALGSGEFAPVEYDMNDFGPDAFGEGFLHSPNDDVESSAAPPVAVESYNKFAFGEGFMHSPDDDVESSAAPPVAVDSDNVFASAFGGGAVVQDAGWECDIGFVRPGAGSTVPTRRDVPAPLQPLLKAADKPINLRRGATGSAAASGLAGRQVLLEADAAAAPARVQAESVDRRRCVTTRKLKAVCLCDTCNDPNAEALGLAQDEEWAKQRQQEKSAELAALRAKSGGNRRVSRRVAGLDKNMAEASTEAAASRTDPPTASGTFCRVISSSDGSTHHFCNVDSHEVT
jgi:hypothetical protein